MTSQDKYYDDYEDYKMICDLVGIEPYEIHKGFYKHMESLLEEQGVKSVQELKQKIDERTKAN